MKKKVIAAVLAGLALFTAPVLAGNKGGDDDNNKRGRSEKSENNKSVDFKKVLGKGIESNQFLVKGTVQSIGTNTFVVNATHTVHVSNILNGLVTVKTDANTKFNTNSTLAVGQNVVTTGMISGTDLVAKNVNVSGKKVEKEVKKQKAMGTVTAKTNNSVTITNTLTNTTQTITTDADTQVKINGETKTAADINVGDKGWVKFKTVGSTLVAKIINLFR